jgi:hypothetical protein
MATPLPPETESPTRIDAIRLGRRTVARLALVRQGAVGPEDVFHVLNAADQRRAAAFRSPERRAEFITSRWLIARLAPTGPTSISHCRRWVAVAETPGQSIGLDVECRLPRKLDAVGERLGWHVLGEEALLQGWTLWEAWRKLDGGSVLDPPDATYAEVLRVATGLYAEPRVIAGVTWFSRALGDAVLSIAVRED